MFEGDVAAHGFPVAVEGEADEVAVCVHDGAAGVAARDVGAVDEAHDELAVLVCIWPKVTRLDELLEALRNDELRVAVVLFLEDAVGRGHEVVMHRVGGLVVAHRAVGEAHCGVGVRVPRLVGHEFTQAAHKQTVAPVKLGLHFRRSALEVALEQAHGHRNGEVFFKRLLLGVLQECGEGFCTAEGRLAVDLVGIGLEVALVLVLHNSELSRPVSRINVVTVLCEHLHEQFAVRVHVVVFEVIVGQSLQTCFCGGHLFRVCVKHSCSCATHTKAKQGNVTANQPGFEGVHIGFDCRVGFRVVVRDQVEGLSVLGLAPLIFVHPSVEEGFELLLLGLNLKTFEAFGLADVVLPVVRRLGVLGGILDAHGLVRIHVALHGLELEVATLHHGRVVKVDGLLDAPAAQKAVRAARVPHDHRVVVLVDTRHADLQVTLGGEGNVVLAVIGGIVVGVGVDAHHAEVARVTWPHPVVGVAAVLAHALGWGSHEADVAVVLVREDVKLVAVVHGLHVVAVGGVRLHVFFLDGVKFRRHGRASLAFRHVVVDLAEHALGDVVDAHEEAHKEVLDVHFLVFALGPKSVRQVIVLWRAEALDGAICTVVVGEHQALRRDDLRRAAPAVQTHDGVLQGSVVDVVNVLGAQTQASFLHASFVDALKHVEEPHAFVGTCRREKEQECCCQGCESFHVDQVLVFVSIIAQSLRRLANRRHRPVVQCGCKGRSSQVPHSGCTRCVRRW